MYIWAIFYNGYQKQDPSPRNIHYQEGKKKKLDRKLNRRSGKLKHNKFVNISFKRRCKERKKLKEEININTRDGKSKTSEVIYHKFLPLFVLLMWKGFGPCFPGCIGICTKVQSFRCSSVMSLIFPVFFHVEGNCQDKSCL